MIRVGLTGGIGSGKSTVSRLLAERGAVVVDADVVAREVVDPGTPGLAAVVEQFGAEVLRPDGALDRPRLGERVFADRELLARLNAVLHPLIGDRTAELVEQARAAGAEVLVHDVPLLVENGLTGLYDAVVVVAASPQTQLERLLTIRGMTREAAQQRLDAQLPLADKVAVATHVIANDGPLEDLEAQVDAVWTALTGSDS